VKRRRKKKWEREKEKRREKEGSYGKRLLRGKGNSKKGYLD